MAAAGWLSVELVSGALPPLTSAIEPVTAQSQRQTGTNNKPKWNASMQTILAEVSPSSH